MPLELIQFKYKNTERLENRKSSLGLQAKTDLERYHYLLNSKLKTINRMSYFSLEDLCLLADACNGTLWETLTIKYVGAEIEDAIQFDELAEKWNTEAQRLINTLKSMQEIELFALIDALERWWSKPDREMTIKSFEQVGLEPVSKPFKYEDDL